MFAHKYNCPLITIATLDYADFMDRATGSLTPWSHVPHHLSYNTDRMSFMERAQNSIFSLYDALGRKFFYLPQQTQLAHDAFSSQLGSLPSVEELEKRISVHLVNSHPAFSYPRPKMPGMIDIAGVHIRPSNTLPDDISKFLNAATDGAIYFSFGSFLRSSDMPPTKLKALLDVFRKVKLRILWKWESDEVPDLPSNVMVKQWMPQADILAHPNVKLFISHAGIFGIQEAIYHAVPMVLFPSFGDQHLNAQKMVQRGIGVLQTMNEFTSDSLLSAINSIMSNQTYYQNIREVSDIFRTNQNEPLDTAIWWIEYVIKYKGAPHLQSHAKNLHWFRYLQLDLVLAIFVILYVICDYFKKLFRYLDSKEQKTEKDLSNKKKDKTKKKKKEN